MRILSWRELEHQGFQPQVDPDSYGRLLWVWFRAPNNDAMKQCNSSRIGQCESKSVGNYGFSSVIRFDASRLVFSEDYKALLGTDGPISGMLHFLCSSPARRTFHDHRSNSWVEEPYPKVEDLSEVCPERVFKARRIADRVKTQGRYYGEPIKHDLFETWLEYPPGFIWETLKDLVREFGSEDAPLVKEFRRLTFQPSKKREAWLDKVKQRDAWAVENQMFPIEAPQYNGPDDFWRYCDNPHWIQTILLARLMGGQMWPAVLGTLEALHGQVTDWSVV